MGVLDYQDFSQITIYTLTLMGTIIANAFLYLRSRKIRLVAAFFRMQLLIFFWLIGNIFKVLADDAGQLKLWINIEYLGICFFGFALLYFAYLYYQNRPLHPAIQMVCIILSIINYSFLLTNDSHYLFFRQIGTYTSIKGPYFYIHTIFSYVLIAVSIYCMVMSPANKGLKRKDYFLITVSLIIPVILNVLYVFNILAIVMDVTPILMNVVFLNFAFIAFRENQYDIQMMTKYRIFDNLDEAIIILNESNRVVEYNKKTEEMFEGYTSLHKYIAFQEMLPVFHQTIQHFIASEAVTDQIEVHISILKQDRYFILSMEKILLRQQENNGMIIKFIEITEQHQLLIELENKNRTLKNINRTLSENISVSKRLILEQERNYVSKELHDILGHSITLVISLLETVNQTYGKNTEETKEKLALAVEITRGSLVNLRKALTRKRASNISNQQLIEELETLIQEFRVSNVEVEFITSNYKIDLNPQYYDTIYRICQESMTNALRHGKATQIMIAVRFSKEMTDIIIVDNGKGCKQIKKGYGIKGMEQRVQEMDGVFTCSSPDGEGFHVHVILPVRTL